MTTTEKALARGGTLEIRDDGDLAHRNSGDPSTPVTKKERCEWLIWNADYHQFWGPNRGGYFGLWGAGLYTEVEARYLSRSRDRRDQAHHISEYRDQINNMRGAFERLFDALTQSGGDAK